MPQFDFFSFFVQVFWICVFSCFFYLIYLKMPLAFSSQVIKMRKKLKSFVSDAKSTKKQDFIYNSSFFFNKH